MVNELLLKYNYFLKFYERRDKFRFLINKKEERKNKVTGVLSSSVIEKFNGCEIIKHKLGGKEKIDFTPIHIDYEPIFDENIPIPCFFTDQIQRYQKK